MHSIYLSKVCTKPTDPLRQLLNLLDSSQRYDLGTLSLYKEGRTWKLEVKGAQVATPKDFRTLLNSKVAQKKLVNIHNSKFCNLFFIILNVSLYM